MAYADEKRKVRKALLQLLRETDKQTAFSRMLTTSLYDITAENLRKSKEAKEKADEATRSTAPNKTKAQPKVRGAATGNLNVFRPNGFYHAASLDFALGRHPGSYVEGNNYNNTPVPAYTDEEKEDWGLGFGNPLVNPKRDCVYIVRARIDQLRADPMIGGFKLDWKWPAGWVPLDGLGKRHLVEASSNPLYVQRLFLSPATKAQLKDNGVFKARIVAWYQ